MTHALTVIRPILTYIGQPGFGVYQWNLCAGYSADTFRIVGMIDFTPRGLPRWGFTSRKLPR